jgi:hypothetical protein
LRIGRDHHIFVVVEQLKVVRLPDGTIACCCQRCDEPVVPEKNPLLDGYDCQECGAVIQQASLRAYFRALKRADMRVEE